MLTYEAFKLALDRLDLKNKPAIAHASLKSFGEIHTNPEIILETLLETVSGLVMPTFTYKTMVIPEVGPPNNGLAYGRHADLNRMTEPFCMDKPADPLMGVLPEALRRYPGAMRTAHPILSFAGVNVEAVLNTQTLNNPFAPIGELANQDGWVLLLGVDHTVNSSIHYAEKLARRRQFVRWALTKNRIIECAGYPGCSDGFEEIRPDIEKVTRVEMVGNSFIEAIPLYPLLRAVETKIKRNPLAMLCQREKCDRCNTIRFVVTET
jgi:aminoglycoside 3-N-acetyltransferase